MKTCPTCNRTYDDETLSFCMNDGTSLISSHDEPPPTQRIPYPPNTDPQASTAVYTAPTWSPPPQAQSSPPQYGAWAEPPRQSNNGGGKLWLAVAGIVGVLLLAAGVGAGIILSRGGWFGANESQGRSDNTNKNDSRSSDRSDKSTVATNTTTPQATPTPTPEMSTAERLGLVGNWRGTQLKKATALVIVSGQGNAFSGTKIQGAYQISFAGTIDPNTRRVTIKETKVVKGTPYSNGQGWSLATETGTLSADGRKMSGQGNDQYNPKTPYSWSYTKK